MKHYYCAYCGYIDDHQSRGCIECFAYANWIETKYEHEYYVEEARNRLNNKNLWGDIIEEEAKTNPLYGTTGPQRIEELDPELQKTIMRERSMRRVLASLEEDDEVVESNVPKCPTCQSTNIKKISVGAKVFGASMFGLFSKTATSQFQCLNCSYKW